MRVLLLIFMSVSVYGQNLDSHFVEIDSENNIIKTEVISLEDNRILKTYKSPEGILISKINYKNSLRDGICYWYHDNGSVKEKSEWKCGLQYGQSIFYYNTGEKEQELLFVNDQLQGTAITYYENGNIKIKGVYKNNKPVGKWEMYSKEGEVIKQKVFDEN